MNPLPLQLRSMLDRKESYQAFARSLMSRVFKPDGTYQPTTERDARIPYWLYPGGNTGLFSANNNLVGAVGRRAAFDLIRRRGGAPDEILWKTHSAFTFTSLPVLADSSAAKTTSTARAPSSSEG